MAETTIAEEPSSERSMLRGTIWTAGFRWAVRLTGLVSTVILARLLTPEDYGVVAIATIIVGAIEIFNQTGERNALIRHPNPSREHYNSAWTISLLLGLGLGLIVFAATPLANLYFHEPRAVPVIEILAIRTAFSGVRNIATVNFQRRLEFHKEFQANVFPTLISVAVTIGAAFALRNYWALVIGILVRHIAVVITSYVLEPYLPRLSFAKIRELWSYSVWTLVRYVGYYANTQVDKIAVGGFAGAAAMGRYEVARDLGTSPTQEVIYPLYITLFPVMARAQNDMGKRRAIYLSALYWCALVCASTGPGVALVASDMVDLVLGAKWTEVKPLIAWLALSYGVLGLTSSVDPAFDTIGRPHISARLHWLWVLGLVLLIFPVAKITQNVEWIAISRLIVAIIITPIQFYVLGKALDIGPWNFAAILWRPIAAGLVMAVVVLAVNAAINFTGSARLALDVALGSATYSVCLMVLWFLNGRPNGPESAVWKHLCRWQRKWPGG